MSGALWLFLVLMCTVYRSHLGAWFGVGEDAVYFQHIANGEAMVMENVDTLVTVSGQVGVRDLEQTLCDFAGEVHVIGDCQAARTAEEAILEGYEVGATI